MYSDSIQKNGNFIFSLFDEILYDFPAFPKNNEATHTLEDGVERG